MTPAPWKKGIVEWTEGDTAYISVVFSWDAEQAYQRAVWYGSMGYRVRVGGPGAFVLGKMLREATTFTTPCARKTRGRHSPLAAVRSAAGGVSYRRWMARSSA